MNRRKLEELIKLVRYVTFRPGMKCVIPENNWNVFFQYILKYLLSTLNSVIYTICEDLILRLYI